MSQFIKKYWLQIVPWIVVVALSIWLSILLNTPTLTTQPPIKDNRIDSLEQVVKKSHAELLLLRAQYDSARTNARTEIEYIQIKNAKEISDISSYSVDQRDSLWATFKP